MKNQLYIMWRKIIDEHIGCNFWMIYLKLNWFFYGLSRMLHLSEFVWILRSSVLVVFNNFLPLDATDKSKIRSDQKSLFIALSLHPLSFFANTPFKRTTGVTSYFDLSDSQRYPLNLLNWGFSVCHFEF